MKRQQSDASSTTRVYSYGTVPARIAPVSNEEGALAQMRLGQRLWNVLVTIERARVEGYRRIMHDDTQDRINALRQHMAAIRLEISARRKDARKKRGVELNGLPDQLAAAKTEMSGLIAEARSMRDARHVERKAALDANSARAVRRIKRARQAAASMGLYWGTYNDIVQRADAGRKHAGELRYRGFRGEGTVTAQVMGGADVGECVEGSHSFFRIAPQADGQKWRMASVRIGSTATREPVWLGIPIVYHRPIPEGARIKSVSATRRVEGGKAKWQLNVTVNVASAAERTGGRSIALDLGWRLLPDGVRVGYWQDTDGRSGQILVPDADIDAADKVKSLRSICDRTRDEYLPSLAAWLSAQTLPEEWQRRSSHIAQWRSPDRLAALIAWWRDNRLNAAGEEEILTAALEWRKQYLHLARWWRGTQDSVTLRIRERYRIFAAQVARDYDRVILEQFDLRDVSEHKPDSDEIVIGTYRQIASPATLRAAVVNACRREGVRVEIANGAYTTRQCHVCRETDEWDQAESVVHRCGKCGALWDQDANAAANLLAGMGAAQ